MAKVRFTCTKGHHLEQSDSDEIEELINKILDIAKRERPDPIFQSIIERGVVD